MAPVELYNVLDETCSTDNLELIKWLVLTKNISVKRTHLTLAYQRFINGTKDIQFAILKFLYIYCDDNFLLSGDDDILLVLAQNNLIVNNKDNTTIWSLLNRIEKGSDIKNAIKTVKCLWKKSVNKNNAIGKRIQKMWVKLGCPEENSGVTSERDVNPNYKQLLEFLENKGGFTEKIETLEEILDLYVQG